MIVTNVVQQHVDDGVMLGAHRLALVEAPSVRLERLGRFDRRLAAHVEGLRIAGESGWSLCEASLETPAPGSVFLVVVRALEDRDEARLSSVLSLSQAVPETRAGLVAALEWTERSQLQGTVAGLLRDRDAFRRQLGIAACGAHRVNPGMASGEYLQDADPAVRARGFRAAGELGVVSLEPACVDAASRDDDPEARFWAAWSAVLLGDRGSALDGLSRRGAEAGEHRLVSFRLALQAMGTSKAHALLQQLASAADKVRWVIQGSAIAGDPGYVPWLIERMSELETARLAGEAFSTITGVQLGQASLDRPAPEDFESGPNDDPDDPSVDTDLDDGLTWPDVPRIEKWWAANAGRFTKGTRYFMGAPVTREHCLDVLKNGYQRQRILAAHYLCLLEPGTPLFNTSAPAWRQQRLLAKMA